MGDTAALAKGVLITAMIVGGSYLFGMNALLNPTLMMAWKGAGVWLLAVYAALNARNMDGWMITAVMAFGAMGDVLVERNLTFGAAAFIVGHVIATLLFLRHRRRTTLAPTQKWLAIVLVPAVMIITWSLTADPMATLYSLFVAVMAASAWISRFSRHTVGTGAMMFLASDLLIFARMGPMDFASDYLTPLIWLLYFAGQVLIAVNVTKILTAKGEGLDQLL
jgi:uncharacterized membrane protein YhhN